MSILPAGSCKIRTLTSTVLGCFCTSEPPRIKRDIEAPVGVRHAALRGVLPTAVTILTAGDMASAETNSTPVEALAFSSAANCEESARSRSQRVRKRHVDAVRAIICGQFFIVPCAACTYDYALRRYTGCNSPFNQSWHIGAALRTCNPNSIRSETFKNCRDENYVHISDWDVSSVTNMNMLFSVWSSYATVENFDADISNWDVSSVTSMYWAFQGLQRFNGDISSWDVSSVRNMYEMFYNAVSFNGDISNWDVSSVTSMYQMFYGAESFNGDLSRWNTVNVNSAYQMFYGATAWLNSNAYVGNATGSTTDGPPDQWCSSNCAFPADGSALREAVDDCLNANSDGNCDCSQSWINCRHGLSQPMSEWDVSQVTDMSQLFQHDRYDYNGYHRINTQDFNADISNWNTQSLQKMQNMFDNAKSFDVDITKWTCDAYEADRSRTNVENMFKGADAWHASYVNTHTGYFDLNLGPPSMWVPVDEYKGDSFFAKDKRVQILIAFVAVLGSGLLGVVVFLIVRCATHRKRTAKKVTTQFRIAHAHNAVSQQQQMLGMSPMPPGAPVLPGRSPIVVTLPAASVAAATPQGTESQQV